VRLVGVAGLEGNRCQVKSSQRAGRVQTRDEPAEPEHPLERLGTVADLRLPTSAELPAAEGERRGDVVSACPRVAKQPGGVHDGDVGLPAKAEISGYRKDQGFRGHGLQGSRKPPGQPPLDVSELHSLVSQLAEREAEKPAARSGTETDPDHPRSRRQYRGRRTSVRARDERPAPALPDKVGAPVRQNQDRSGTILGDDLRPHAGHKMTQRRRRGALTVSGWPTAPAGSHRQRSTTRGLPGMPGSRVKPAAESFKTSHGRPRVVSGMSVLFKTARGPVTVSSGYG
jgi:hypothetical protein